MPALFRPRLLTPLLHTPSPSTSPLLRLRVPRAFSTTPTRRYAAKDSQDKDSLNPKSTEFSKSGGDDAAAQEEVAFDPSSTKPEEAKERAGAKPGGASDNPLQVSPGNPEVSKARDPQEGGAQKSASAAQGERKSSGAGSGKKDGGGKSG